MKNGADRKKMNSLATKNERDCYAPLLIEETYSSMNPHIAKSRKRSPSTTVALYPFLNLKNFDCSDLQQYFLNGQAFSETSGIYGADNGFNHK